MRWVRKTDQYSRWFSRLRDTEAKARILVRIRRLSLGNPGERQKDIQRAKRLAQEV